MPAVDEATFSLLVGRHRRELHVHCYRMMGSFEEAEDLVQETLLHAWRARESVEGRRLFRAWLYRIATNACLDALRRRARRPSSVSSFGEVPWLQPYPDRLLDQIPSGEDEPDAIVVAKETIELAFLAVIQALPPIQRAVLILRDVLGWSARETAEILETTVAAANSALQRARAKMEEQPARRPGRTATQEEQMLLEGFIDAHERADADAAVALLRDDVRITMPPHPWLFEGIHAVRELMGNAEGTGDWRLLPTRANRMPTAASYLRQPGDTEFRAFKLDVLRVEAGRIAEVTTFDATLFPAFGLPPEYPAQRP
jgi:RNA polymerase sigma-70 factor (TIGR02960 family)